VRAMRWRRREGGEEFMVEKGRPWRVPMET
jgi:hypothetical protein